jgi:PAS domain S-box-containing protein
VSDLNTFDPSGCMLQALSNVLIEVKNKDRLAALRALHVLDSPAEPEFDDIVTIASALCDTPVALISLVDADRQWFKSRLGFAPSETPLEQSVCAHALANPAPLIIPDLTKDHRTLNNPLVTGEPHIRFYAGAPLLAPLGHIVGSLCVIDFSPRHSGLDKPQTRALVALARQVMTLLEMRRLQDLQSSALVAERKNSKANLRRAFANEAQSRPHLDAERRLRAAQEAGQIGTFEIDLQTDEVQCSRELCRIYGLPVQESYPAVLFESRTLPEDRQFGSTRDMRAAGTAPTDVELRIRRVNDGAVRWISRRGQFVEDATGQIGLFIGTVTDITERKAAENRQAALVELGDELRQARSSQEVERISTRVIGQTLNAVRVAYCAVDADGGSFNVKQDWTAPGYATIVGLYSLQVFQHTLDAVSGGEAVQIPDIGDVDWLRDGMDRMIDRALVAQIVVPVARHGTLEGLMTVHDKSRRHWLREEVEFVKSVADRTHMALEKIKSDEQQRILNEELSHRLKNTLAMVQAIASQTLRHAEDQGAVEAFRSRITALSQAHDILLRENWASGRIWNIVQGTLSLHTELLRVTIQGDDISLGPKAVLSLTLLLHELATNALKYGSLSVPSGQVDVRWFVDYQAEPKTLCFSWRERGGPAVAEPQRRGFGSRLIRMGLSGTGDTTLSYARTGLRAEFRAPLSFVVEN